jgi:hypothetical protein
MSLTLALMDSWGDGNRIPAIRPVRSINLYGRDTMWHSF